MCTLYTVASLHDMRARARKTRRGNVEGAKIIEAANKLLPNNHITSLQEF